MSGSIVIAGAGLCGARAAFALRDRGFDGRITLVGSERHVPYDRPPLSKQMGEDGALKHIAEEQAYRVAAIECLVGVDVTGIDRDQHSVRLGDGRVLRYDRLLLATGARPRPLPGASGLRNVFTLRTYDDALAIRALLGEGRRLIVVGGGFIGLELAATARQLGSSVCIIEGLPRLMARAVPAEIAAIAQARHIDEGVEILLNTGVASIIERDRKLLVTLSDSREIAGDLVVVGIGALPNTQLAEGAGLAVDNGIAVDMYLATSDPDIFAAGDCCSFPLSIYGDARLRLESWRCAQDQGTLVAGNLLGARTPFTTVPWFWSDQYDLTLQIAGLPNLAVKSVRRDLGDGAFLLFHLDERGRLLAASGIGRGNVVGRDIRLAEMLIAARAHPSVADLSSPAIKLKSLLAA